VDSDRHQPRPLFRGLDRWLSWAWPGWRTLSRPQWSRTWP